MREKNRIKTLQEVAEDINEDIGEFKKLDSSNGYFMSNFRSGRGYELEDTKIRMNMSFKGTNQPTSFGYFKSQKGYNSKLQNKGDFANHYGEYIASIILKQLGKKACKVDLGIATIRNRFNGKETPVKGSLSHFQLRQDEMMIPANIVIEDFKALYPKRYRELTERGRTNSEKNYTNIELILKAFEHKFRKNGQEQDIPAMRQELIDMCVFDILFANRDRHDENFGLRLGQETGRLSFYHLYDNEQILGMQEKSSAAKIYLSNEKEYEKFKETELTSCIGIPGKIQKIQARELLEYLLQNYPNETRVALEDFGRYKLSNLEELLGVIDGLSQEHKDFAKKIFVDRQKEVDMIVKTSDSKTAKNVDDEDISL